MGHRKGFVGLIFNRSFSKFVTTRVIKVLLVLAIIVNALVTIGAVATGFTKGTLAGIVAIVLSPLIFIFLMLVVRIYLEVVFVIFRIADELKSIRVKLGGGTAEDFEKLEELEEDPAESEDA